MSDEKRRILNMLAEGKITAAEAEELLDAIAQSPSKDEKDPEDSRKGLFGKLKYLRIMVEPKNENGKGDRVNIRIPMQLLRAGMKLASIVPGGAKDKINDKMKEKGIDIDLNNLDTKSLEEVVEALGSMSIDVDDENEKVKIFVE